MDFPILESDRLILKNLTHDNKEDIFKHFSNEEVNKYVDFDAIKDMDEAIEIIDWGNMLYDNNKGFLWGIFRKSDNVFMGQVNFVYRSDDNFVGNVHRAEIGIDLSPSFWGNGYMTNAVSLAVNYIYNNTDINRIEAIVNPINNNALKLLDKFGFNREGILKEYVLYNDKYLDMALLSLIKSEYINK